ncbi:MAG: phytoene desaturase family protein, partial [Nitrososphaerales archaeon]
MPEYEFDGVVIGGGHNALVLAAYMAKSGLKVVVLERLEEVGGAISTERRNEPGFIHNMGPIVLSSIDRMPWYVDLEMELYGVRCIHPNVPGSMPLLDGRALIFHREIDVTCRSIARLSMKDAETYRTLYEKQGLTAVMIMATERFSPPLPPEERESLLMKSSMGRNFLEVEKVSALEKIPELFESDPLRATILNFIVRAGLPPEGPIGGFMASAFPLGHSHTTIIAGGTHLLAKGLEECISHNGGIVRTSSEVAKIIVKDGEAKGAETSDGTRFMARKFVVSSVDPPRTFLKFVGDEHLDGKFLQRVRGYKFRSFGSIVFHAALQELPKYTSSDYEPLVNDGLSINVGYENLEMVLAQLKEMRDGLLPEMPCPLVTSPTVCDPSQAQEGKHTTIVWQLAPYELKDGGIEAWEDIKEQYMEECFQRISDYAPNINAKNIIYKFPLTVLDVEKRLPNMVNGDVSMGAMIPEQSKHNRPFPEVSSYRT